MIQRYTATLITAKGVILAEAGIQENTGFRVKPGMTNYIRLMSSCIVKRIAHNRLIAHKLRKSLITPLPPLEKGGGLDLNFVLRSFELVSNFGFRASNFLIIISTRLGKDAFPPPHRVDRWGRISLPEPEWDRG